MPNHKVVLRSQTGAEYDFDSDSGVRWDFTTGAKSRRRSLIVTQEADRALSAAPALESWRLVFSEGPQSVTIEGVLPIRRVRSVGRDRYLWEFSDFRHLFSGYTVDAYFNSMREVNDFDKPSDFVDANIAEFSKVPKSHFVPHTCRKSGTAPGRGDPYIGRPPEFEFFDGTSAFAFDKYEPWTALQALLWLIGPTLPGSSASWSSSRLLAGAPTPLLQPVLIDAGVKENGVLVKRWNPRAPWSDAVDDLCRRAHVILYVGPEGRFHIAPADPSAALARIIGRYGQYSGEGGIPTVSEPIALAPRIRRWYFPRYDEIPWVYDEIEAYNLKGSGASVAPTRGARAPALNAFGGGKFFLENSVKNPNPVANYVKGQDVEFMDLLNAWANDGTNVPNNTIAQAQGATNVFNLKIIHKHIWNTTLAHYISVDRQRPDYKNPLLEARVATMYQGFRRRFRIPEVWLDQIEDWRLQLGTIFSTTTRARVPSPVFVDYSAHDSMIHRPAPGSHEPLDPGKSGHGFLKNYPIELQLGSIGRAGPFTALNDLKGAYQKALGVRTLPLSVQQVIDSLQGPAVNLNSPVGSPFSATKVDGAQGVFGLEAPPDLKGQTLNYDPFLIDPGTVDNLMGRLLNPAGRILWAELAVVNDFRMVVPISVRWKTPNNLTRHFVVEVDGQKHLPYAPKGPVAEHFFPGFEAFHSHRKTRFTWTDSGGPLRVVRIPTASDPVENFQILQEIAEGESAVAYYSFLPRVIGTYAARGWTGDLPVGGARSSVVSKNGGLDTEYNAEAPPHKPSVWEFFSPFTKTILGRLQEKTGSVIE